MTYQNLCAALLCYNHVLNIAENYTTVKPLHNGYLGDREKWLLHKGGCHGEERDAIFLCENSYQLYDINKQHNQNI